MESRSPKQKCLSLYEYISIYKLSGELVGHLSDANTAGARLNKLADKLFHGD
jgi:hypothetical protein